MKRIFEERDRFLALSIGIVYLWFGILKFFPGASPAEGLAKETIDLLTFGLIPSNISYFILAFWETSLGILLILNIRNRFVIMGALLHIVCTFSPLFLLPQLSYNSNVITLTLIGQYIIKNVIIIAVLITIFPRKKLATARVK